jgi:uncharacterized protein (DUF58 family)
MINLFRRRPPRNAPPMVRRMRDLQIASARLIRAGFAGDYHSAFHGRGIEFSQVREYQPGDDIRTIDWNVTARSGAPYVKEFVEERDLTVVVVVDVSGSMSFGSLDRRKCDLAAELTAVFAFAAVENADRIGLLLFADGVRTYLPPRRGTMHARLVVRTAVDEVTRCGGVARIDTGARFLERVTPRRAVLLLISDFLQLDFERTVRRLNKRHDLIAVAVSDPREEWFPPGGLVRLVDAESGLQRVVDTRKADLSRRRTARSAQIDRRLRAAGVDHLELSTAIAYDEKLLRFFRQRSLPRR